MQENAATYGAACGMTVKFGANLLEYASRMIVFKERTIWQFLLLSAHI
jgi:hypothetical protein